MATWTYKLDTFTGLHQITYDIVLTEQLTTGDGTVYGPGSVFGGPITCTINAA